jgi:CBS-domain-containing membrane protein
MHMKELPYLEHEIKESFDICTVSDVMSAPVVTLKGVEEAQHIEKVLLTSNHQAFPVLDQDTNQYVGLIRRDQLVALLECGLYLESLEEHQNLRESMRAKTVLTRATNQHVDHVLLSDADAYSSDRKTAKLLETHEWLNDNVSRSKHGSNIIISKDETLPGGSIIPRRGSTVVDVNDEGKLIVRVAHDEKHMHVDVSAAMNRGAFTVMQNCPLSKAHSLFTGLGLRHLPVLGRDGSVVGIVARSNLNPEYMEGRTGLDMHH